MRAGFLPFQICLPAAKGTPGSPPNSGSGIRKAHTYCGGNTLLRQQILILHLSAPDLASRTIAWALYDGAAPADAMQMQSGDQSEPPYSSVLAAMRDGWFVIQIPSLPYFIRGLEHETGHLPYEYVLERRV